MTIVICIELLVSTFVYGPLYFRTPAQVKAWHNLVMNYIISGRKQLIKEATSLLDSLVWKDNQVVNWKVSSVRLVALCQVLFSAVDRMVNDKRFCFFEG